MNCEWAGTKNHWRNSWCHHPYDAPCKKNTDLERGSDDDGVSRHRLRKHRQYQAWRGNEWTMLAPTDCSATKQNWSIETWGDYPNDMLYVKRFLT